MDEFLDDSLSDNFQLLPDLLRSVIKERDSLQNQVWIAMDWSHGHIIIISLSLYMWDQSVAIKKLCQTTKWTNTDSSSSFSLAVL